MIAAPSLGVDAMGTRFEVMLDRPAAAEAALAEIVRLESRLSAFRPSSDISWINAHASTREVKVEPRLFALLQRCFELSESTDGAFDITVGPLMRAWRFREDTGAKPSLGRLADARLRVGYQHMHLDPSASTVRFARQGMSIDLGAAGKGYAIDQAIAILRDHGVTSALLHGGTSSVHAIGRAPGGEPWRIAWSIPTGAARILELDDGALSVSAPHGKSFCHEGQSYGHVMDPRTGWPTTASSAVVTGPCSLECDALSTALLVHGRDWVRALRVRFPGYDGIGV
jgi:thiamine biosynthesis lipoprotein